MRNRENCEQLVLRVNIEEEHVAKRLQQAYLEINSE